MLQEGAKKDPQETYVGFIFVSGEGINKDGEQHLVLNQFDDFYDTGFYKLYPIEYDIRYMANNCKNAYLVCIFATSRYAYDAKYMQGHLS